MPYGAPSIPDVPSSAIDRLLRSRFSDPADNVLKAIVGHFVCAGYQSIMMTYYALRRGSLKENYRLWVVSCVLVSITLTLACFVVYKVVMASGFIVKAFLFYGLVVVALLGLTMGTAGIILYDRNTKEPPSKEALEADEVLGYEEYKSQRSRASSTTSAASSATKTLGEYETTATTATTTVDNRKNN